ncbi:putative kinectin (Kinesin receptor) (CG-1 antigen) [Schistosoma mansoni]|uniref:putative kinectin (Kinesin receptor) (CG-1 antigen) n=1 Tax=Schistosoma mansoni TaxID=6183 RepID=UPI00022DCC0D|nr:putative kinectin (Kinesin receptor) (CG-1 antigen) [Schistosoma mansoni]|eukprot:XP_018655104.1 putative kinectin (Kinesin receptor) (CG-1 antigen) [Schistosoma mansoni]
MEGDSVKDLAAAKLKAEIFEKRYHEIEYEKEKYREEARLAKNHLELTETALKNAEEKLKEYQKNIKKLEDDLHTYELLKHRSQAAVVGLQKVARESQDNVIHLETRLRNLTESQNSEQKNLQKNIDEFNKFRLELGRRVGLSEMNADLANVMEKKINLLEAKNADLTSQLTLLQNMSQAKEIIIKDLRNQIDGLQNNKQLIEERNKQTAFKLQMESTQMKALLTSLSASLSTIDKPCQPTEIGVKESIERILDQIVQMREHKAGLAMNTELKQARERVQQAETDCARMETELSGLHLLYKQDQELKEKIKSLLIQLCDYLGIQIDHQEAKPTEMISGCLDRIEHLLNRGCLPWVCVQSSEIRDHHHFKNHEPLVPHEQFVRTCDNSNKCLHDLECHQSHLPCHLHMAKEMPENDCNHKQIEHLTDQIIKNQGQLSLKDWRSIKKLCNLCNEKLVKCFSDQLSDLFEQITEIHKANVQNPKCNDQILAKLQEELESKQIELNDLKNNFELQIADRDKQIEKLNTSLKLQLQKMEKLQKSIEQQHSKSQSKHEAFKMAKSLLVDVHDKKKKLGTFRDLIGKMLDVDTRFSPNPDMMIFQRLQQLIDFAVSSRLTSIQPDITTSFSNTHNNTFYPFVNSSKPTMSQIPIKQLGSTYTNNLALPLWDQHREGHLDLQSKHQGKIRPTSDEMTQVESEKKQIHRQSVQESKSKASIKSTSNVPKKSEPRIQKDDRQY